MKLLYVSAMTETQCTSIKAAMKLFGGDKALVKSLLSRIDALAAAVAITDIIALPMYHFHKLSGDREGYFAIDVKTHREKWRIILRLLDENGQCFQPCHIDQIVSRVKIIEIMEVSPHYE